MAKYQEAAPAPSAHRPTGATSEPEIHLPGPSFSPALLGLGVTLLAFGILFGLPLIVIGFGLFLVGLITWLVDDARAYGKAPDQGHH